MEINVSPSHIVCVKSSMLGSGSILTTISNVSPSQPVARTFGVIIYVKDNWVLAVLLIVCTIEERSEPELIPLRAELLFEGVSQE